MEPPKRYGRAYNFVHCDDKRNGGLMLWLSKVVSKVLRLHYSEDKCLPFALNPVTITPAYLCRTE